MKYYAMFIIHENNARFTFFNLLLKSEKSKKFERFAGMGILKDTMEVIDNVGIEDFNSNILEISEKEFCEFLSLSGTTILSSEFIFQEFIKKHPEALI